MLPKAVEEIINGRILIPEVGDMSLDHLSIPQINHHFRNMIQSLQKESKMYDTIVKNRYYIVLLPNIDEETSIVKGEHFLDFSIVMPSEQELRTYALSSASTRDVFEIAVKTEHLFKSFLLTNQKRLRTYAQYLSGVRDPMNVARESLFVLMHFICEMKRVYELRVKYPSDKEDNKSYHFIIDELSKQIESLSLVFSIRDI